MDGDSKDIISNEDYIGIIGKDSNYKNSRNNNDKYLNLIKKLPPKLLKILLYKNSNLLDSSTKYWSANGKNENSTENKKVQNEEKTLWMLSFGCNGSFFAALTGSSVSFSIGIAFDVSDIGNSRFVFQSQENGMLGLGIALQGGIQIGISKISIPKNFTLGWTYSSPYHIEGGIGWGPFFGGGIDLGASPFQKKGFNFGLSTGLPLKVGGGAGVYLGGGIGFSQSAISIPLRFVPIYPINFP
jgi:hypothetical protein